MGDKVVYIHYGDNEFFTPNPIVNDNFVKPSGGMWACRKDDPGLTWKAWCEKEDFHTERLNSWFEFTLKDDAKVLLLEEPEQLDNLPQIGTMDYKTSELHHCTLDFEQLAIEYDAIELTNIGKFYWKLYGWDVNCILIMNPDCIEEVMPGATWRSHL